MSNQTPNHEEASNLASEFIYSLENLPNEVSHLLQEIKFKENRSQELQQEIDRDSSKYIRHSLRAANSSNVPSSPTSRAPSPKSSLLPAKIASSYAEIQSLATEKCILAQRLIELITFTRSRLDSDLAKVRNLQGEVVEPQTVGKTSALVMNAAGDPLSAASRNPALQITESLRTALSMTSTPETRQVSSPAVATPTSTAGHVTKKRRLTSSALKVSPSPSIKGRSASPTTVGASGVHTTHQRSRLSRQIHPTEVEEDSMDADGDEDAEGEDGDGEDERLYCICQKQSYGDMIACDNEGGCPYEWFHLSCVGMKQPVPEKWYCPDCRSKGIGSTTVRKGRKK